MKHLNVYKAQKGLIRVSKTVENGKIVEIRITGDFFIYPETALEILEKMLVNVKDTKEDIEIVVKNFFKSTNAQTPFVNDEDFVLAIAGEGNES